jgi:hypothetical protein
MRAEELACIAVLTLILEFQRVRISRSWRGSSLGSDPQNLEDEALAKLLRDISRRALENLEEKGLSTLFVIFGMATWPATDGGTPGSSGFVSARRLKQERGQCNSYHLAATGGFQIISFCCTYYRNSSGSLYNLTSFWLSSLAIQIRTRCST